MPGRVLSSAVSCLILTACIAGLVNATTVNTAPGTEIPLSTLPGMEGEGTTCAALQQIATNSPFCTVLDSCDRLQCNIAGTVTDFGVMPCTDPPSISAVSRMGNVVIFNRNFSRSQTVPIIISGIQFATVNVSMSQSPSEDAITVQVTALLTGATDSVVIIPETTIPIDRSRCYSSGSFPHPSTSSTSSFLTISPPTASLPSSDETCQALNRIAATSATCTTEASCTALDCDFLQYHSKITILPCNNPPAIKVVIQDSLGRVIVNETLSESRTQNIGGLLTLIVTIRQVMSPESISLKVAVSVPGLNEIVLVPETTIPIDRSRCTFPHTPVLPSSPPTSPQPNDETCQALQQISSSASQNCHTSPSCSSVICSLGLAVANLTILPCRTPPAVRVKAASGSNVFFDDTLTEPRLENITLGGTTLLQVNITVKESPNLDYILLKIEGVNRDGSKIPIIPETRIPIDRCACPDIDCVHTTIATPDVVINGGSTGTSDNQATTSSHHVTNSQNVATTERTAKAGIKFVLILGAICVMVIIILVVIVLIIIVGYLHISKRRFREFTFQRITFNDVNNDDDNVDD